MKILQLDNDNKFSIISRIFHWVRVLLLFLIALSAFTGIIDHRKIGVIFFVIISLNILWRLLNKSPKSFGQSNLEVNIAKIVHNAMYVLMLFIPILGYFSSMGKISILGLDIPPIYSFDWFTNYLETALNINIYLFRSLLGNIHKFIVNILIVLICLHIFIIICNKIFRKTGELKRML